MPEKKTHFEAPTWQQVDALLAKVANQICSSGFKPDFIVGVCRGGWIPARILSDLLCNANLANVRVECYVGIGEAKEKAVLTQSLSADVKGKRVMIVDEIADSGKSLQLVVAHIKESGAGEVKTATLYTKPKSAFKPDFCGKQTPHWVVFPWEINETINAIYKAHESDHARMKAEFEKLADAGVSKQLINRLAKAARKDKPC